MMRFVAFFMIFFAGNFARDKDAAIPGIPEILARGHKYVAWFSSDGLDSLLQCMVDKEQGIRNVRESRRRIESQFGRETELLNEMAGKSALTSNRYYYVRHSRFSKIKHPVKMEFSFDSADHVFQLSVETLPTEAPTKFLNYKTKTTLRLPFNGPWYVAAGGLNIHTNHHAVSTDQRFAYDFLVKKDGFTFQNDGRRNEDHYCYGKEILSPGVGKIVKVVNNVQENKPGEMLQGAGNCIVIDHGNGEFSILAHLKRGSIAVKAGDGVETGQFLGRCGNSGHAAMAHLHYHLQNSPVIFEGEGLPIQFQSYLADGKAVEKGEPRWSQCVAND